MRAGWRNQQALLNNKEYNETMRMEVHYRYIGENAKADDCYHRLIEMEKEAAEKDREEMRKELEEEKEKTLRRLGIIK